VCCRYEKGVRKVVFKPFEIQMHSLYILKFVRYSTSRVNEKSFTSPSAGLVCCECLETLKIT
jgi:hypothetical protein